MWVLNSVTDLYKFMLGSGSVVAPSSPQGDRLGAAVQKHGFSGQVLRRTPEERWDITIDIDVCVNALAVIAHVCSDRCCRGAGPGLLSGRAVLLPLTVPLTVLVPHRDLLRGWWQVARPALLTGLLVEIG
jgi:hypothetical protein